MKKTNAMRILDTERIEYKVLEYEVDESDLSGVHVAEMVGQDPGSVFKTLVLKGEKQGHIVCCIPVNEELDLKQVARVAKDKKVEMIAMKDLLPITGYIRGGCTAIGMKKKFPVYVDENAMLYDEIAISAGIRGMQLVLKPEDFLKIVEGVYAEITIQ